MEVTMRAIKGQALAIFSQCTHEEVEVIIEAKAGLNVLTNEKKILEEIGLGNLSTEMKMSYDVCKDTYSFAGDFASVSALVSTVAICCATTSEDP